MHLNGGANVNGQLRPGGGSTSASTTHWTTANNPTRHGFGVNDPARPDVHPPEAALRDHQEWCLGDAAANQRLIQEVVRREGGLNKEALVAAAEQYRLAREGASRYG